MRASRAPRASARRPRPSGRRRRARAARRPPTPIAARGWRPSVMSESNWPSRRGEPLGVDAVAVDDLAVAHEQRAGLQQVAGRHRPAAASRRSIRTRRAVHVQARARRVPRRGERHVRDGLPAAGAARRAAVPRAACRSRRRAASAQPVSRAPVDDALLRGEALDAHARAREIPARDVRGRGSGRRRAAGAAARRHARAPVQGSWRRAGPWSAAPGSTVTNTPSGRGCHAASHAVHARAARSAVRPELVAQLGQQRRAARASGRLR